MTTLLKAIILFIFTFGSATEIWAKLYIYSQWLLRGKPPDSSPIHKVGGDKLYPQTLPGWSEDYQHQSMLANAGTLSQNEELAVPCHSSANISAISTWLSLCPIRGWCREQGPLRHTCWKAAALGTGGWDFDKNAVSEGQCSSHTSAFLAWAPAAGKPRRLQANGAMVPATGPTVCPPVLPLPFWLLPIKTSELQRPSK